MDFRRLGYFLFTNFITFSTLIMVVLLIVIQRKKSEPKEMTEKTEQQDLNPDQIKTVSSSLSDIGLLAGLTVLTVLFLYTFTIPVLRDIPHFITGMFFTYKGTVIENSGNETTVEIDLKNNRTEKVEISGLGDLQKGDEIVLEYLPNMEMRVNWYQ